MSPGGQWVPAGSDYGKGLLGTGRLFGPNFYDTSGGYVGAGGTPGTGTRAIGLPGGTLSIDPNTGEILGYGTSRQGPGGGIQFDLDDDSAITAANPFGLSVDVGE